METTNKSPGSERAGLATAQFGLDWVWPRAAAKAAELSIGTWTVGRGEGCDLILEDDEASRVHAELVVERGRCTVRDLESTNGTFVNGHPVSSAMVEPGDVLRLGACVAVARVRVSETEAGGFLEIGPQLHGGDALRHAVERARRAAVGTLPILVEGETGVGKERVATAVHAWSGRTGPFIAVNCASIPPQLAEASLFGHRKGAFTGADASSSGYMRAATGGTLLLDEIHELSPRVQATLLRAVELGEVTPLGESRAVPIDVRLVATSPRALADYVDEGAFRADLYARLAGVTVRVPPLRERREDILELFLLFVGDRAASERLSARFVERLLTHDFPLNVRELRQLAQRLAALVAEEPQWTARHFDSVTLSQRRTQSPAPGADVDLEVLRRALSEHDGNLAQAARSLRISRQRAYRMLDAARKSQPPGVGGAPMLQPVEAVRATRSDD